MKALQARATVKTFDIGRISKGLSSLSDIQFSLAVGQIVSIGRRTRTNRRCLGGEGVYLTYVDVEQDCHQADPRCWADFSTPPGFVHPTWSVRRGVGAPV
jgi:hypothetical protein